MTAGALKLVVFIQTHVMTLSAAGRFFYFLLLAGRCVGLLAVIATAKKENNE